MDPFWNASHQCTLMKLFWFSLIFNCIWCKWNFGMYLAEVQIEDFFWITWVIKKTRKFKFFSSTKWRHTITLIQQKNTFTTLHLRVHNPNADLIMKRRCQFYTIQTESESRIKMRHALSTKFASHRPNEKQWFHVSLFFCLTVCIATTAAMLLSIVDTHLLLTLF